MNRSEFIKQIMDLYPRVFSKENPVQYQGWINRYKNAIPEDWDFDKLMYYFDTEWKSAVEPPHPSFFMRYRQDVKPEKPIEVFTLTPEERAEAEAKFQEFKQKLKSLANDKTIHQT